VSASTTRLRFEAPTPPPPPPPPAPTVTGFDLRDVYWLLQPTQDPQYALPAPTQPPSTPTPTPSATPATAPVPQSAAGNQPPALIGGSNPPRLGREPTPEKTPTAASTPGATRTPRTTATRIVPPAQLLATPTGRAGGGGGPRPDSGKKYLSTAGLIALAAGGSWGFYYFLKPKAKY
jgi:hypothetical protein